MAPLTRPILIAAVREALEPLAFVHCLWEGGSAGFGRVDEWSDVDLQAEVDDDRVAATFDAIEAALGRIAKTSLLFAIPEPAWHGHSQRFYQFANADRWLLLDFCVMKRSAAYKFNEPAVHGAGPVLFDRSGLFGTHAVATDRAALEQKLRGRIEQLRARFAMFQVLVEKEVWRAQPIDALSFYQSLTLAPLVELLRIKHDPLRHNWAFRYLHRTLPAADADRVAQLMFVPDLDALPAQRADAETWFDTLATELAARQPLVPTG